MNNLKKSGIRVLDKKAQKEIAGGMCPGGGYPIPCDGVRKCPHVCFGYDPFDPRGI